MLFSFVFSQGLVGRWGISKVFWNKAEAEYELSKANSKEKWAYGNFIEFKEDGTFESFYVAECGNDCFPTSKGVYQLLSKHRVELMVTYISQNEFCEKAFEKNGKWHLGTYKIIHSEEGVLLSKEIEQDSGLSRFWTSIKQAFQNLITAIFGK